MLAKLDVISLTQSLIQYPSITPQDKGIQGFLSYILNELGFICHPLIFEDVHNLYARRGQQGPNFCFLGHTDVVPIGNLQSWTCDPFAATLNNDKIYGRGAVDMKGAIASYISAIQEFDLQKKNNFSGSLSFLITGDEEGPGIHGTQKVLKYLKDINEKIDFCLVGEPTSVNFIGDTLKIGRRGSLSGILEIEGQQGHVAYPENFVNPIKILTKILNKLYKISFDQGSNHFPATNFEVLSIDVNNKSFNVIPAKAQATFNLRFNDQQSSHFLQKKIHQICAQEASFYTLDFQLNGEAFLSSSLDYASKIQKSIFTLVKRMPLLSTSGGTSDARFMHKFCPVIELGLKNKTAHQVNEYVSIQDLKDLQMIYNHILNNLNHILVSS